MKSGRCGNHTGMRSLVCVFAVFGVAGVADAAPCSVNIARAPDAVRDVVTSWVLAEKDCGPPLEVRIVETPEGLYVLARDEAGHVHERIVPDAQSAGVLVASWAASGGGDATPVPSSVAGEMSIDLSWSPPSPIPVVAPGTTPSSSAPVLADTGIEPTAKRKPAKWMSLGGMIGIGGAGAQGVRGEFDLAARGRFRIGVAGSLAHVDKDPDLGRYSGYLDLIDMQAVLYAAHTVDAGHWQLRAGAGAGFIVTKGAGVLYDRADINEKAALWPQVSDLSWVAEASLSVSHGLGWNWPSWGFELGPVVTLHDQSLDLKMGSYDVPTLDTYYRTTLELMFYGGIRHEL
jgi:hypothetical protein